MAEKGAAAIERGPKPNSKSIDMFRRHWTKFMFVKIYVKCYKKIVTLKNVIGFDQK